MGIKETIPIKIQMIRITGTMKGTSIMVILYLQLISTIYHSYIQQNASIMVFYYTSTFLCIPYIHLVNGVIIFYEIV